MAMLEPLLPLRGLVVTVAFTRKVNLPFFHQAALTAFLRYLLGSPDNYDQQICIDTPESGRIEYQSGDHYRFTVFFLPHSDALISRLIAQLVQLPHSVSKTGLKLHFCDNLILIGLHDLWQNHSINEMEQLTSWTPNFDCELWRHAQSPLTLRWLTPARLLKKKTTHSQKNKLFSEQRYCRGDDDLDINLWFARLYDSTTSLLRRLGHEPPSRPYLAPINELQQHQFWLDHHYRNHNGKTKPMGGISGIIQFSPPISEVWLPLLIFGQYLGIGQLRVFGWGRYRLEAEDGSHTLTRAEPATSLLQRAMQFDNIQQAADSIYSNSKATNKKAKTLDELERLAARLPAWQPSRLQGALITKNNGEPRALAIAPVADRIQQRAVAQVLTPAIDQLLAPTSYGFRRGKSRQNAALAIQQAWRDGYRWVYESDIDDFFDSVQRDHLAHRLHSLFPDEPLIPLILAWMAAPVEWDDKLIERRQGVPQGSPLSPLMTNLLLDDFDRDMAVAGFVMIRFADDFVVACKNPEQAQKADQLVRSSLSDLSLEVNEDKTHTRSFEQGFRYLGYLFMNDLVVTSKGQTKAFPRQQQEPAWLVNLERHGAHKIEPDGSLQDAKPQDLGYVNGTQKQNLVPSKSINETHLLGQMSDAGTLLLITGEPTLVSSRAGQIWVTRDQEDISRTPWEHVTAMVIIGRHHITTPTLVYAMDNHITVHFLRRGGKYIGSTNSAASADSQVALWNKQQHAFADLQQTLPLAHTVIQARIRHMRETLRPHRQFEGIEPIRLALRQDQNQVIKSVSNASLNGIEGAATRRYYQALQLLIPAQWQFNGRNRRPPADPVNAMLSLGYTLLYSHTDSMLRIAGLMPWCGFYHQPRGTHAALASDLMEPFRHWVESTVLSVINRQQIDPSDFTKPDDQGVKMHHTAQKIYLTQLEKRFLSRLKVPGQTNEFNLHGHLHQQNMSLKQWLANDKPFSAFVMR